MSPNSQSARRNPAHTRGVGNLAELEQLQGSEGAIPDGNSNLARVLERMGMEDGVTHLREVPAAPISGEIPIQKSSGDIPLGPNTNSRENSVSTSQSDVETPSLTSDSDSEPEVSNPFAKALMSGANGSRFNPDLNQYKDGLKKLGIEDSGYGNPDSIVPPAVKTPEQVKKEQLADKQQVSLERDRQDLMLVEAELQKLTLRMAQHNGAIPDEIKVAQFKDRTQLSYKKQQTPTERLFDNLSNLKTLLQARLHDVTRTITMDAKSGQSWNTTQKRKKGPVGPAAKGKGHEVTKRIHDDMRGGSETAGTNSNS